MIEPCLWLKKAVLYSCVASCRPAAEGTAVARIPWADAWLNWVFRVANASKAYWRVRRAEFVRAGTRCDHLASCDWSDLSWSRTVSASRTERPGSILA